MTQPWEEALPSSARVFCIVHLPDLGVSAVLWQYLSDRTIPIMVLIAVLPLLHSAKGVDSTCTAVSQRREGDTLRGRPVPLPDLRGERTTNGWKTHGTTKASLPVRYTAILRARKCKQHCATAVTLNPSVRAGSALASQRAEARQGK